MARTEAPSGKEISDKAKAAKHDIANAVTATKGDKKIKFTPADFGHIKSITELEDGQFIGELETEVEGDKAGLPPGKYNALLTKIGSDWHVYAESGGQVVAEAISVVERKDTPHHMKPQYSEGSFCWWVWLVVTGFQWCF